MTKFLTFILFIFSVNTWSQTEFFNSKIIFLKCLLEDFCSSISSDSSKINFTNHYKVYAQDRKISIINGFYSILGAYDLKNNKTLKVFCLNKYNPRQVILDGNYLWLISRTTRVMIGLAL